jgi:hypothetical protein
MEVSANELLSCIEKNKDTFTPYFTNSSHKKSAEPEWMNLDQGKEWHSLHKVGVQLENLHCVFKIPYSFNAAFIMPATVEDVTSPTLILSVRTLRSDKFKYAQEAWAAKKKEATSAKETTQP